MAHKPGWSFSHSVFRFMSSSQQQTGHKQSPLNEMKLQPLNFTCGSSQDCDIMVTRPCTSLHVGTSGNTEVCFSYHTCLPYGFNRFDSTYLISNLASAILKKSSLNWKWNFFGLIIYVCPGPRQAPLTEHAFLSVRRKPMHAWENAQTPHTRFKPRNLLLWGSSAKHWAIVLLILGLVVKTKG